MEALLEIFSFKGAGDERDGVRGRVANYIKDYFLDEQMMSDEEKKTKSLGPYKSEDEMLRPWCMSFGGALENWKNIRETVGTGYEKVQDAYNTLAKKIDHC